MGPLAANNSATGKFLVRYCQTPSPLLSNSQSATGKLMLSLNWVAGYDESPKRMNYTGADVTLDIDISQMSYGLHFLNYRSFNEHRRHRGHHEHYGWVGVTCFSKYRISRRICRWRFFM